VTERISDISDVSSSKTNLLGVFHGNKTKTFDLTLVQKTNRVLKIKFKKMGGNLNFPEQYIA